MKQPNTPKMEQLGLRNVHDVRIFALRLSGMIDNGVALGNLEQCREERDLCVKALEMAHAGFFPFFVKTHGEQMLSTMIRRCEERMQSLAGPSEEETLDVTERIQSTSTRVVGLWGGGKL